MRYEADRGVFVDEAEFHAHPTIKWLGASPDGLVMGANGLIEIKCPNTQTHLGYLLEQKVPAAYINQIQTQLWVTGRSWCDFVSFDPRVPERLQLLVVRMERDEKLISVMEAEVEKFLIEVEESIIKLGEGK
jgi:predicted phage-related endonuclease